MKAPYYSVIVPGEAGTRVFDLARQNKDYSGLHALVHIPYDLKYLNKYGYSGQILSFQDYKLFLEYVCYLMTEMQSNIYIWIEGGEVKGFSRYEYGDFVKYVESLGKDVDRILVSSGDMFPSNLDFPKPSFIDKPAE